MRDRGRSKLVALLGAALVSGLVPGPAAVGQDSTEAASAQPWLEHGVRIVTLSNRADLISGGDALVEVLLPDRADPAQVTVTVDDRDVTDAFARRDDGRFYGRFEDLAVGINRVTATLPDGSGAYLDINNHPVGGPVFAGPQVQPWICTTEREGLGPAHDSQCNAQTRVEFFHKNAITGQFSAYDPANPPVAAMIATTTTDEGHQVPYIIRQETGTMDRGIYRVAVLYDPTAAWEPWDPQVGWNRKLYYPFGGGCGTVHSQVGGYGAFAAEDVQLDIALSRGFMVAASSLNVAGNNCNTIVSAEAVMMLKEHIVERYGEIRYTFGTGCSGGSFQQHQIANSYPGLLQGIQPACSFSDALGIVTHEVQDCHLLNHYYHMVAPHLWGVESQQAAVNGHQTVIPCEALDTVFSQTHDPRDGCELPADQMYDPDTNPAGCRGTLQDYMVAVWGTRPQSLWTEPEREAGGFANWHFDNVGVQYGLAALNTGEILPEQFVDLNERIGGPDIDLNFVPGRRRADPGSVEIGYRTGRINDATQLDQVAIIDLRGTSNNEFHTDFWSYATRERLIKANGHADNHIIWTDSNLTNPNSTVPAFLLMDEWLAAVEFDTSEDPLDVKIVRNMPADAVDACWIGNQRITDTTTCQTAYPYFGDPRVAARGPLSNDVLQCALKPLNRSDYTVEFTDEQWGRLEAAFPDGVCDYSQDSADRVDSVPWLTFLASDGSSIPGGEPLGDPPVSVPFGSEGAPVLVTRHDGPTRIETAVAVSASGIDAAETVVVTRADEYADALTGGPLAAWLGAPLLLSASDALSAAAAGEIRRLGALEAVLLGGEAALGPQVAADLETLGLSVRRVGGANRFGTAAAIARELPANTEALVARGDGFADALAASGLGSAMATPILLVEPQRLPEETAAALSDADVTIVGGVAAVSDAVAADLDDRAGGVSRVGGETRYATSAAVADAALAAGVMPATVWVATGTDFPDALVAGAAAGRDHGVLLLIDGADLTRSPQTREWLASHAEIIEVVRIAGGTAAVSAEIEASLAALL